MFPMRIAGALLVAGLLSFAAPAAAQDALLAPAAAAELREMCEADRGRLWSVSLCGPLIIVDPATRSVWASQADGAGALRASGAGWTGALPEGVPVANTSVEWAGARWIMVIGPLPEDATERRVLVAHEAWHRVQGAIGLASQSSDCIHLETERARYLLRLEFRALATAMRSRGSARRRAAREALMFRMARLAAFPAAAAQEAALDRNEGLASYTGVKLGAGEDADMYAARTLDQYDRHEAYARAYAYASGPAYGLLLDQYRPDWRIALAGSAPADLLAAVVRARAADPSRLGRAAQRYGGQSIAAEERQRAEAQRARLAELRARFSQGPRLEIGLGQIQFEFDPLTVSPVEGLGSVYRTMTLRDRWGELRATEGALISADFTRLTVAQPGPDGRSGPGWTLALNPGFTTSRPDAEGVVRVIPAPPAE
jgi:hypothetical protein